MVMKLFDIYTKLCFFLIYLPNHDNNNYEENKFCNIVVMMINDSGKYIAETVVKIIK